MRAQPWFDEARWIWLDGYDDTSPQGKIVLFRRFFDLDEKPSTSCLLRVSADTRYRFFVNGISVSIGPCKSYPSRWYFETVDVSPYLKVGENVFSVRVLRFSNMYPGSLSLMRGPFPGLIVHCKVQNQILHSNSTWQARLDESVNMASRSEWNYALGPPFLVLNETVNSNLVELDWHVSEPQKWSAVKLMSSKSMMLPVLEPWNLTERPIPVLPEIEARFKRAVTCTGPLSLVHWNEFAKGKGSIEIPSSTTVTVDLEAQQLTTAFLSLECLAGTGARIKLLCAECYETQMIGNGPGAKRQKTDRTDHLRGTFYGPSDNYLTREGKNVYEPFWFRTFRYVQLEIQTSSRALRLDSFVFRETHYPLEIESTIQLSPELDKMWEISLNTLKNCMHETYEDCPFYEQNQFIMDSRLQILFTYQVSRDDRLARKTIREFHASQRDDGLLMAHFPSPGRCVNIPNFSLFWIHMIHDHMTYFADPQLVRAYVGTVDGILSYFHSCLNEQGLVAHFEAEDWAFVDWVKEWQGTTGLHSMGVPPAYQAGAATFNSLVYSWTLQRAAELNDYIKRPDTATEYRHRATVINTVVNRLSFDGSLYQDGPGLAAYSQHCQVFAVLSGTIDGISATNLMRRTLTDSTMPRCSYAMSFYVLRAAGQTKLYEEMYPRLIAPWRKMMEDNLTTWAEDDVSFRSDCHGWSSSPIYEIVAQIFGLTPGQDSFEGFRLAPLKELLPDGAKANLVTKYGMLKIAVDGNTLVLEPSFDSTLEYFFGGRWVGHTLSKGSWLVLSFDRKKRSNFWSWIGL